MSILYTALKVANGGVERRHELKRDGMLTLNLPPEQLAAAEHAPVLAAA